MAPLCQRERGNFKQNLSHLCEFQRGLTEVGWKSGRQQRKPVQQGGEKTAMMRNLQVGWNDKMSRWQGTTGMIGAKFGMKCVGGKLFLHFSTLAFTALMESFLSGFCWSALIFCEGWQEETADVRQRHKTRRAEVDGERGENRSFDLQKESKVLGCQRKRKMTHFSQPDTGRWSRNERRLWLYRKWIPNKMSLKRGQPTPPPTVACCCR